MNTHILVDHEPVADGGSYVRAVLMIAGTPPSPRLWEPGRVMRSVASARRLSAMNVRVEVRPGLDAEFIQMRHTFESESDGDLLTVNVGNVHCLDMIRVRMEALVGRTVDGGSAEVATLVVRSECSLDGSMAAETVSLPLWLSPERGGWVRPVVSRAPVAVLPTETG